MVNLSRNCISLCPPGLLCVRHGIWFGCWDYLTLNLMFLVLPCISMIVFSETQAAFSNKESVQKEVKATLSQKATLSCEVSDTKTEVKWYKGGKLLTTSKTVHMETKDKTRQLVLDIVEKEDAGEYTCEVGAEKVAFKIQVAGRDNMRAGCLLMFLSRFWWVNGCEYTVCVLHCHRVFSPKQRDVIPLSIMIVLFMLI